jgi:hypothetical protein
MRQEAIRGSTAWRDEVAAGQSFNLDESRWVPAQSVGLRVMKFIATRLMTADSDDSGCE